MKKTILIICVMMTLTFLSSAKAQKPFKPLIEFQKDTVSYLEYNYGYDNSEALKGKSIKEFLCGSDIQYTTFKFIYNHKNEIEGIQMYLQPYKCVTNRRWLGEITGVHLDLAMILTCNTHPEIFQKFDSGHNSFFLLSTNNIELLRNIIISSNECVIQKRIIM